MTTRAIAALLPVALAACGSDPAAPDRPDAGEHPTGCVAGEVTLEDGACRPAGVPAESCGVGFASNGDGACDPILPEPCPAGQMAVPGETACRPVAPCEAGDYGAAPEEPTTQHVSKSYAAADSDGTVAHPWPTIQQGVDAAADGAAIAIAEGTYAESVTVDRGVRLWGRCPELVEIGGVAGTETPSLTVLADAAEVHDLAVTGDDKGIVVEGAADVVLERIRIDDTTEFGIGVRSDLGPTRVTARGCLVDHAHSVGILVLGSTLSLEGSLVRDSLDRGLGAQVEPSNDQASEIGVSGSVFERNFEYGLFLSGAVATVSSTVVRDTLGVELGIGIELLDVPVRATGTIQSSVVERFASAGIVADGSDGVIEGTVVRDSTDVTDFGVGVYAKRGATLALSSSAVERATTAGVIVEGADATLVSVLVRDVTPRPTGQTEGLGIGYEQMHDKTSGSSGSIRGCVVDRTLTGGIAISGSTVSVESTLVRATAAQASDGFYGDGIFVEGANFGASVDVTACRIEGSARAGIANFSAHVAISGTTLECNPISLDGEQDFDPFDYEDLGGNVCGCGPESAACAVESAGLTPPKAFEGDGQ